MHIKIEFSSTFFLALVVVGLVGCSPKKEKIQASLGRDCSCPMPELPESSRTKSKDSTNLETDFYDWSIDGKIAGVIKKIIDAEISTSNRSKKSKYEISTKEVVNEIRNDFPELIDKNFEFKLKRVTFCTYHDLICKDESLPDSVYRALMIEKLSEFKEEINELFPPEDLTKNSLKTNRSSPRGIDNRQINASIYTENQSGGTNTVNITSSLEYKVLSNDLRAQIVKELIFFKEKHRVGNYNWININIESGSSMRRKLATDLDFLLKFGSNDWALFHENIMIGTNPENPISVFFHPDTENIVKDLLKILSTYIKEGFVLRADNSHLNNTIDIFINGTPNFNENGQVRVE